MAKLRDPVKPESGVRYEHFVEQKLAEARGRIRTLDLTAGFLGLLVATMMFAIIVGWLDRWFQFSLMTRQWALGIYGLVAMIYIGFVFLRPLLRPLNPYYAARQVETVLPGAKNSVINWLDLRHETLPSAIRGALSHRAAKDIGQANLEEAIRGGRTLSLGAVTLILFLITVAFMFFGPGFGRVFQPIGSNPVTEIRIIKPEGGNGRIAEGRAATIEAVVHGRQTEALRFLYRHHQTDPYEERPMERGESSRDWVITVPAFEVHNGFWYKLIGTEAATDEYHIEVRSAPAFSEFEITYHPRAYLRLPDETVKTHQPELKGIRGTEVQILARTNRQVRVDESGLIITGQKDTIKAEPVADDPQAMRFRLVLDQEGSYGIQFTSAEGERNNPIFYGITVLPDKAPEVRITKPENETISLPANGVLQVEGSATDDYGLTGFALRMQIKSKDGPAEPLPSKPYSPGKSFQFADGSYPLALDYHDFVELSKVRPGQLLQPKTVLEYWLEATDNCDFPAANVGRSKSKFVTISAPDDAKRQEEKKAEAQKEKEKKQAEQEQKLKEQNQAQQGQPQPQENSSGQQKSPEEKKFEEIQNKLQEQLQQQAKQQNPDGSNSEDQKDSNKGDGNKNPKGEKEGGNKDGQPKEPSQDSDKSEGGKNPKNGKKDGMKEVQPDQKPGDDQGKDENKTPQDPQKQGKEGKPNKDDPKGDQDGGPKAGQKKQEKSEDSKGNEDKKEENKGAGQGAKATEKKASDPESGQANANSPPKPGTNNKGPEKEGQSDQPGQEKPANSQGKKPGAEKPKPGEGKGASPEKGETSKDDGSSKDKSDQGKPNEAKQGDKQGDSQDGPKAQMQKKINELVKAMKEGDAKAGEKARQELEKMSEQAKTPAERQAAKDALKQADQGSTPGEKAKGEKNPQPGEQKASGEKKGESSDPDKSKPPQPGEKKSENGKPGDGSSNANNGKPSKESGQGKGDQDGAKGSKGDKASDQNPGKPGSNSGGASQGSRENPTPANSGAEAEAGTEANQEFQKRAGALQLEDYRKKITKEMLQKAKISPKDYKEFLQAYQDKLNREGADRGKADPLVDPRRPGGSLTNRASKGIQPGKKEDKLPQAGRAGPPPGYDDSYSEFRANTSKSSPQK
jgi:hypothetical protein